MDLQGHELRSAEVPACANILQQAFAYQRFDTTLVLRAWPHLISEGLLKGWVVGRERQMPLCFGASVFVTDAFASMLARKPIRYVGNELVKGARSPSSPLCAPGMVDKTKLVCEGVNIVIVHSGLPLPDCDKATASRIKALMMQGSLWLHNGFNVSQILVEAFGATERLFYTQSNFEQIKNQPCPPSVSGSALRPSLLRLTRARVISVPIHPLLPLFTTARPRCAFSSGEQALLVRALDGHTDRELATLLGVSVSAVKKRWAAIFDRAEGVLEIFASNYRIDQKRGTQKRHVLTRYVREHPEELRPPFVRRSELCSTLPVSLTYGERQSRKSGTLRRH